MTDFLSTPIEELPRTQSRTIARLKHLGIHTYEGLLRHYPSRYKRYIQVESFSKLRQHTAEEPVSVTVIGEVVKIMSRQAKYKRMSIQIITLTDGKELLETTWFNQPYIMTVLKRGARVRIAGIVGQDGSRLTMKPEEYELDGTVPIHTGELVPIYPETYGISSKTIREKIAMLLRHDSITIQEILPPDILQEEGLIDLDTAIKTVHFPVDEAQAVKARDRLEFDELFCMSVANRVIRADWEKEKNRTPYALAKYSKELAAFIQKLPFTLTTAQVDAIKDIEKDVQKDVPMNRLVQGDVGSGKTVVATYAAYATFLNGYKTLYMAPTEILAQQHFETIQKLFSPIRNGPRISLITGSTKRKDRSITDADIIIGTHALLFTKENLENVGLVIIDEQHKFGVGQRAELKKKGLNSHLLSMTATPIPRTISLTLYGELDLSLIDELPKGRKEIKSYLVPKAKRADSYTWIQKEVEKGAQVYWVCPFIEESEKETMSSVKAALKEYELMKTSIFPDLRLGLLHGKMKAGEKNEVMEQFVSKKIDILVSTPVIEVGIDNPNAHIIVIETAERFGLAQLHQLRGRVGRGDVQSYCLLFQSTGTEKSRERLEYFCHTASGFKVAEYDLHHRGAGDIYGTQQHGMSAFKIASLTNAQLVEKTTKAAERCLAKHDISTLPELAAQVEEYVNRKITRD